MLAGHTGYMTGSYRRYTKKQLTDEYLKGEHLLTIQAPKELQEIESEFRAKIQTHSDMFEHIIGENIKLKQQILKNDEEFEQKILKIQSDLEQLFEMKEFVEHELESMADEPERQEMYEPMTFEAIKRYKSKHQAG